MKGIHALYSSTTIFGEVHISFRDMPGVGWLLQILGKDISAKRCRFLRLLSPSEQSWAGSCQKLALFSGSERFVGV
jgi:hypothetical protein